MDDLRNDDRQYDASAKKPKIKEAIIVEGKYDKVKLDSLVDAVIVPTGGFSIFRNPQKANLIRRYANTCGIIILTDSDRAGFIIRNYVQNIACGGKVKHAYIPDILGKEKRKTEGSKAGTLGVEGMERRVIEKALCDAEAETESENGEKLQKSDLYFLGLSGREDSKLRREKLLAALELPKNLSANGLVDVLNATSSPQKLIELCEKLFED